MKLVAKILAVLGAVAATVGTQGCTFVFIDEQMEKVTTKRQLSLLRAVVLNLASLSTGRPYISSPPGQLDKNKGLTTRFKFREMRV